MPIINIKGLRGLSAADRADWEKSNVDSRHATEEYKDRTYRNQQFFNAFGSRDDYETMKTWSPEQRDRYYANWAFGQEFKDDYTVDEMKAMAPEKRDEIYNNRYTLDRFKTLYGQTDVYNQVINPETGIPNYEMETIEDLMRLGIKPESEIAAYESQGLLGYVYTGNERRLADGNFDLMRNFGESGAGNAGHELWSSVKGFVVGGLNAVGGAVGDVFNTAADGVRAVKWAADELQTGKLPWEFDLDNLHVGFLDKNVPIVHAAQEGADTWTNMERAWMREKNNDMWADLNTADYQRKLDKGSQQIEALQNYLSNIAKGQELEGEMDGVSFSTRSTEGIEEIDKMFDELMAMSPYYRQFKDTKYIQGLTTDQKIAMLSEAMYMASNFSPEVYSQFINTAMQGQVANSMNTTDRLANGAKDIYHQALAGTVNFFIAQSSVENAIQAGIEGREDVYRQGFNPDGSQTHPLLNPIYWEGVTQYGTTDWSEIKRIKYGVGEDAYKAYAKQMKEQNPDISDEEIENTWIQDQWDKGQFLGDQLSQYMTVYDPSTENDAFGLHTVYGAAGMTGQVLSQFLLAKGIGGMGRGMKWSASKARMARTANVIDKATPYAQVIGPTLPIAESYAQGAYEKAMTQNREALEQYVNSDEFLQSFRDEADTRLQTEEVQAAVEALYQAHKTDYIAQATRDWYDHMNAAREHRIEDGRQVDIKSQPGKEEIEAAARQLAARDEFLDYISSKQEEEREKFYGHMTEGAEAAYWTSFGIEAFRYGVFNLFNRQWLFGDASKKIRGVNPGFKITSEGAVANAATRGAVAKEIAKNVAKEFWNSGKTNYMDELTTAFAVGFGTSLPNDYMGRIRKDNSEFDGIYGAMMNGLISAADVADDPSSIQAGIIGSLGFLVGGMPIHAVTSWVDGTQGTREQLKQKLGFAENDYSWGRKAFEWATYLTGNSAMLNVSQKLGELDNVQQTVNKLNKQLQDDAQALSSDGIIREMTSLLAMQEAAAVSGDAMTLKNANYMSTFHSLKMLEDMRRLGGENTRQYEDFMTLMRGYAEGRITEADVNAFLGNPANSAHVKNLGTTQEERTTYAKERIQKNAEKFLEINDSWQRNKPIIDRTLGDLSQSENENARDFYYDLLFKMSWSEDVAKRLESMEKSISGSTVSTETTTPMIQRLIADKGGAEELIQGLSDEVRKHIEGLKAQLSKEQNFLKMHTKRRNAKKETIEQHQKKADKLQGEIDRFKVLQDKYGERLKNYAEVGTPEAIALEDTKNPIRAEQILRLNPEERLFMFTHPEEFSKRQQAQIEKARAKLLKTLGGEYLETMRDIHVLGERALLNDEYIANVLAGNDIQGALDAISTTRMNERVKTIKWLAQEKMKSIRPLIRSKVTKKLLTALVGAPIEDIRRYSSYIAENPVQKKTLDNALEIVGKIKALDHAIEVAGLSDADKRKVTNLIYNALMNAKELSDVPKLIMELLDGDSLSVEYRALLTKVLEKYQELVAQQQSTENNETEEVKKEAPEDNKDLSLEDQLIEKAADKETGEYKSLTPEQLAPINPDIAPVAGPNAGDVTAVATLPENTQGTSLQGNWVNGYDVNHLRETGEQVAKKGNAEGDTYNRWLEWTSTNGYNYQNVVDFELTKMLENNPELPIHMMTVQGIGEATKDGLIKDAIMLVVEATDAVKKIHNENYGHYVTSNGKEYLIIGRAGLERSRTKEQEANYAAMSQEIKAEQDVFFKANPTERFYVSDKYITQVRYVNGGNITTALVGESPSTHNIAEMLGDAVRDPFGIGKLENLGWYIQVGTESREPIGLPSKIVREGNYYTPADKAYNNGAVFAMVPAGNGKYMPIKINPATLTTIQNGKFKDLVKASAEKIASPDYAKRHEGIVELLKMLVLDDSNNVLIGSNEINAISIVRNGETLQSMRIGEVPATQIVEAIMQVPFRVNINQTTFQDPVRMKQLAEAGAFTTDVAVLGGTGNNYSVYAVDADGNILKETAPVGNEGYVHKPSTRDAVLPYKGATARRKNGQWVIEELGKDTRVVTSPTERQQLDIAAQIDEQQLVPVRAEGNYRYFIISADKNNPLAVKRDINTGEVIVPTRDAMIRLIEQEEAKAADRKAQAAMEAHNEEAAARGKQMQLGEAEETESLEEVNEEKAQKGTLMSIGEDTGSKEKTSPVVEKVNEETKKVAQNLHNPEKSSTFAELYSNPEFYELIDDALVEKFGKIPDSATEIAAILSEHDIPVTGITDIDAWLDMIKNCR